jgi:hypothetical protein
MPLGSRLFCPLPVFFFACLATAPLGCAHQARFSVLHRDAHHRSLDARRVLIEPLRFDDARIEGVSFEAWLAAHGPRDRAIFQANRVLLSGAYQSRIVDECERRGIAVVSTPVEGALVVRARVAELSPGFWAQVDADAEGRMWVELLDEGAATPFDTIEVSDRQRAEDRPVSSEARVQQIGDSMGAETARYLLTRVAPSLAAR